MLSVDDEWASFISQSQPSYSVSLPKNIGRDSLSKASGFRGKTEEHSAKVIPPKITTADLDAQRVIPRTPTAEFMAAHGVLTKANREIVDEDVPTKVAQSILPETAYEIDEDADEDELVETLDTPTDIPTYKINELFISTKTKVLFLNQAIDINDVFWKIPIEEYWRPVECVVKKQMKIVSKSPEEYDAFMEKLKSVPYYTENIIKQINNPTARRIKFKDERKITVGISKKDIMNCRGKVKNAFYNCFAIIIRFKYQGEFREIHVKIFNTGKLEIPGVLNAEILEMMRQYVLKVLQPHISTPLAFIENSNDDNVLINSNFNCGFYIDREKLFSILRSNKYGLETAYDPCIYPGIKCKYYFNNTIGFPEEHVEEGVTDKGKGEGGITQTGRINAEDRNMKMSELGINKTYTEVSFMIFRTGSCLIVGNCSESILQFIFQFIKNILIAERSVVAVANEDAAPKIKHPKLRKKSVNVSANYLSAISK